MVYLIGIMNKWRVALLKKAGKQREALPRVIRALIDYAIADLEAEGPHATSWDIKKTAENEYRLRLNYRYRMRYTVKEHELIIEIFYLGHRKDAYK